MTPTDESAEVRESPARRLGILYVASLSGIALLSVLSQTFVIRELSWQNHVVRSLGASVGQQSIDRSLSLAALAIQAAGDSGVRREHLETLRKSIAQWRGDSQEAAIQGLSAASQSEIDRLLHEAGPHRDAALGAAKALLAQAEAAPATPRAADVAALVRTIVAEEGAYDRTLGEAALCAEREAAGRFDRLKALEYKLFAFTLVVLLLEGLFVISPTIKRIQHFTAEMRRSHEELRTYAGRLERSNRELQDFASVASHDLQEPLRKVMAFSDRLKTKYGAVLDDTGRDYLERVQNASRRMQTLINDLLTYARVTTKAQPFIPTDLAGATRDVLADLEARIEQVRGTVEVGELPTLDADPLQVRQLIQNLVGNALKYHRPEAPPVVRIYSRRPAAGAAAKDDPSRDRCEILVEDNGIGFEEVYSERIFTIFQRLHGRTEYEGTGVGLAVCRKIVDRHNGTITARSTPGKGSTFTVTLPLRQAKEMTTDGTAR